MNFYSHAVIAARRDGAPELVLGAMLPDFAGMIRARVPRTHTLQLQAGLELHQRTDAVFHEAVAFRRLTALSVEQLRARGVARGAARAAAHVGLELLLDGALQRLTGIEASYLEALSSARSPRVQGELRWDAAEEAQRFTGLVERLSSHGLSPAHTSPELVALRLEATLAPRPRLALRPGDLLRLRAWAADILPELERATPDLLRVVEAALEGD